MNQTIEDKAVGKRPASGADAERLASFAAALDAIHERALADMAATGPEESPDVAHVRRVDRFSRAMEIVGRSLIHVSLDPVTFSVGVGALWLHKQIQVLEIGHTALHGVYDAYPNARRYHARRFRWDLPVDEQAWTQTHFGHHANPNVLGKDDILHFGLLRAHPTTPWRWYHRYQLGYLFFGLAPNFGFASNVHVTGLNDFVFGNGETHEFDFISDRSLATLRGCMTKAMRKWVPYYAKNYVLYPLLAGPFFPKVLFGNWLAETMRDVWMAATIMSNHIMNDTVAARPASRGAYLAMQVEATTDVAVSLPVSILCGGLDCHIEHHLFPRLPPNRLREIRPEVEAACEAHGVRYRRVPWPRHLGRLLRRFTAMSRKPRD